MKQPTRFWILFISFSILFGVGNWALEVIEGSKILTTEHIEFGNLLIFSGIIVGILVFLVILLPLTLVIQLFFNKIIVKIMVYSILGFILGKLVFSNSFHVLHVQEFQLNESTSFIIFTGIGVIYALLDIYASNRLLR